MAIIAGICGGSESAKPAGILAHNFRGQSSGPLSDQAGRGRPWARRRWAGAALASVLLVAGCAGRRAASVATPAAPLPGTAAPVIPPAAPGAYVEKGIASWYGFPFQGRRAADGEIFNMNSMVAAHRTLPFGSVVRVTNLTNGRFADVRIIDRGPFVDGRILDLAFGAARALDMVGAGTAMVRIELLSGPNPSAGDFTVQIGAFADLANAERLRDRLLPRYHPIFIQQADTNGGRFYRVRVGRAATADAAQRLARQLRESDGFETFVLRLDSLASLNAK